MLSRRRKKSPSPSKPSATPEPNEGEPQPTLKTTQEIEIRRGPNIITGPMGKATAAEDYKELCAHELTFKVGEELHILQYTEDPKWAIARSRLGRKGLVPITHFERAPPASQDSMQVYLGNISKKEAEDMLRQEPYADGKFLVRDNVQYQGDLTLSVAHSERASGALKFAHYRIAKDKLQLYYVCEEKKFISIRQLVDYYMNQQSGLVFKLGIWFKSKTGRNKEGVHAAINHEDVKLGSQIGKGHFGKAYSCVYKDKEMVAKVLKNRSAENAVFEDGGRLAGLTHPNILKYHGYVQGAVIWVIMDYCNAGNLKDLLNKEASSFPIERLEKLMASTAEGMAYLESENVIHRNLKLVSLLIDSNGDLKISDYGWGTPKDIAKGIRFPIKWTAPEAFAEHRYDTKSDVWSFGVVIYEMFTKGKEPYEGMVTRDILHDVFVKGHRLSTPPKCPAMWGKIMPQCFQLNPAKRPTFASMKRTRDSIPAANFKESLKPEKTSGSFFKRKSKGKMSEAA